MPIPLSEQLRPKNFHDLFGQEHLLDKEGWIQKSIQLQKPLSILLFGPPGCGKTTFAKIYAKAFDGNFISLSSIFHGAQDLKKIIFDAKNSPVFGNYTILFVDEIHRFNKTQQDIFLPFIEDGTIILIGATTENPSFAINNALLSRMRVLELKTLNPEHLVKIIDRYEKEVKSISLSDEVKKFLVHLAQGDARHLLNLLENLELLKEKPISLEMAQKFLQKRAPLYDKGDEQHYNLISALHKSVRGSDPDASLYWLARMLNSGEDPLFIIRRMIRMSIEDIGLADPEALKLAIATKDAYEMLGSPEADLAIAQTIVYLALAPKSNSVYTGFQEALEKAKKTSNLPPPLTILNAPTNLMKEMGYGKNYQYDHDLKHCFSGQNYFPDGFSREVYYYPKEAGFEREMKKRIDYFSALRKKLHPE